MWTYRNNILIQLGFICLFVFNALGDEDIEVPIINTKQGRIQGKLEITRNDRHYFAYLGIPYAEPPLGHLRFQKPEPPKTWSDVRQCVNDSEICMQRNIYTFQKEIVGSEDCLYLNVYKPYTPEDNSLHAVMIWFHGGGWIAGSGRSDYYGAKFLLDHNIILVTVNYRLGPLGFLSMEDETCRGNAGLRDQNQAMQWVKDNIIFFSGNPDRVTIFGESAGGASVHYHMVSPLSRGLFHRAISQSGNLYNPWTIEPKGSAKQKAMLLGQSIGCYGKSQEVIDCLKRREAKDIIAQDDVFQKFGYCPMIPFRPVVETYIDDDHFLVDHPLDIIAENKIADVPWMTGITSEEGALKVAGLYGREKHLIKQLNDNFTTIAPMSLFYKERYKVNRRHILNEITNSIREFYYGDKDIDESDEARYITVDLYSDAWFNHGTHQAVRDLIEKQRDSPVFYYYFSYRGNASFSSIFGDPNENYGVSHADELQYLFPVGEQLFKDKKMSSEDQRMIDLMIRLWVNFANFGHPTPKGFILQWDPVKTYYAPEFLHIETAHNVMMKKNLLWQRMAFWDAIVERLIKYGHTDFPERDEF